MELRGTHVLITGTTTGIGRQLAQDLLPRGCTVTSLDRSTQTGLPSGWTSIGADIRDAAAVTAALKRVSRPIDILINNAGVMRRGEILQQNIADFDELMAVNVRGSWLMLHAALPMLKEDAMIVQISSRHAVSLPKNPALYGLSKRWATDMMEVIAKTYPRFTVKIVCPGPVDTPLARTGVTAEEFRTKQRMMCSPQELSSHIIKLLETNKKNTLSFDTHTYTHFLE